MEQWIQGLGNGMVGMLVVLSMLAGASAVGSVMLRLCQVRVRRHPIDAVLVATMIGLALITWGVGAIGWLWLPGPKGSVLLSVVLGLAGAVAVAVRHRECISMLRHLLHRPGVLFLIPLLMLPLGKALAYPVGWDELVYHLAIPMRWLADGKAIVYSDMPYSALPSGLELVNVLMLGAGGITAPGALNYLLWLVCAALLYRLLRSTASRLTSVIVTAVLLYTQVMLMLALEVYVEMPMAACLLAGLMILRHERGRLAIKVCVPVALLCGFASAMKPTGVLLAPALLIVAWRLLKPLTFSHIWRVLIVSGLVFLVVILPFFMRPWVATGNPLYPYYASVFTPMQDATLQMSDYYHQGSILYGLEGWWTLPISPFALGWMRAEYDGTYGYQWLIILAVLLCSMVWKRQISEMTIAGALCFFVWFATAQQARFALSAVVLLWLAGGRAIGQLRGWYRHSVLAALAVGAIFSVGSSYWHRSLIHWKTALGAISTADNLYRWTGSGYLPIADAVSVYTEPDACILMLFEHRTLYIPRQARIGTPFWQDAVFMPPEQYSGVEAFVEELHRAEADYVVLGFTWLDPDRVPAYLQRSQALLYTALEAIGSGALEVVYRDSTHMLLRVREP